MLRWLVGRLKLQIRFDGDAFNGHHGGVNAPAISLSGQGQVVHAYGEEVTFLLEGKHTGGRYTMFFEITPPGGGPPPHYHKTEDEWFYVLEGTASFFADGEWTDVPAGGAVFMPKGNVHTFKNNTGRPLKQLIQTSPSGFEDFLRKSAEEFARPGGPDMDRIMQIAGEHGIHFV
jgi:quercetin dioxygenase-like cupin family protein